jgi:hypothetical protein
VQESASATSRSAVSRRFVAATKTALAELLARVSGYDLTCCSAYDLMCRSVFGELESYSPRVKITLRLEAGKLSSPKGDQAHDPGCGVLDEHQTVPRLAYCGRDVRRDRRRGRL